MTRPPFGPLVQNAFVVPDIESAIDDFAGRLEVGPFFRFPPLEFVADSVRGRPVRPVFHAAITSSGDLMVELIEPAGPSIFAEFIEGGGAGVHHNCVVTQDHDASVAWLEQRGARVVQHQEVADGSRMSYLELAMPSAPVLEVAQLSDDARGLFAMLKVAAQNWDGIDPRLALGG